MTPEAVRFLVPSQWGRLPLRKTRKIGPGRTSAWTFGNSPHWGHFAASLHCNAQGSTLSFGGSLVALLWTSATMETRQPKARDICSVSKLRRSAPASLENWRRRAEARVSISTSRQAGGRRGHSHPDKI